MCVYIHIYIYIYIYIHILHAVLCPRSQDNEMKVRKDYVRQRTAKNAKQGGSPKTGDRTFGWEYCIKARYRKAPQTPAGVLKKVWGPYVTSMSSSCDLLTAPSIRRFGALVCSFS